MGYDGSILKLVTPQPVHREGVGISCRAPGCSEGTKERKPYCPEHLDQLPYVQRLLGTIAQGEREIAQARRRGVRGVDPSGLVSREVLRGLLQAGEISAARLARTLAMKSEVLETYLRALAKRGLVELRYDSRGRLGARVGAQLAASPLAPHGAETRRATG